MVLIFPHDMQLSGITAKGSDPKSVIVISAGMTARISAYLPDTISEVSVYYAVMSGELAAIETQFFLITPQRPKASLRTPIKTKSTDFGMLPGMHYRGIIKFKIPQNHEIMYTCLEISFIAESSASIVLELIKAN